MGSVEDRNRAVMRIKGARWSRNAAENRNAYLARGGPLDQLWGKRKDKPVLLLGPGPSLDLVARYVEALYAPMAIICCNSALNPLAARGVVPDLVVVLDAEPKIAKQIEEYVGFVPEALRKGTRLVPAITVDPGVVKAWPHEILWYAHWEQTTEASVAFFASLLAQFDQGERRITRLACTSCVLGTMVQVAYHMGASPVFLAGFELPTETGVNYAALRYDLSTNPPRPVKDQIRDVDWKTGQLHAQYVSVLLNLIQGNGIPVMNLSPLASFKNIVLTVPPSTLITGEMRLPEGVEVNSGSG